MYVNISKIETVERSADARGRVRLGRAYSGATVWAVVTRVGEQEQESDDVVDVQLENVVERSADSRGRVRVGTEFAGEDVEVTVLRSADR